MRISILYMHVFLLNKRLLNKVPVWGRNFMSCVSTSSHLCSRPLSQQNECGRVGQYWIRETGYINWHDYSINKTLLYKKNESIRFGTSSFGFSSRVIRVKIDAMKALALMKMNRGKANVTKGVSFWRNCTAASGGGGITRLFGSISWVDDIKLATVKSFESWRF